jgi:hypothetical protein
MRIHLDGKWDAAEFSEFFRAMNDVYQYYLLSISPYPWEFGPRGYLPPRYPFSIPTLKVKRIEFASPGFTDLAGIAAAIREVREFMQFVIQHMSGKEDRSLDREDRRLSLAQKRVDLLRAVADLERDHPGRYIEMSRLFGVREPGLPDIDPIISAIEDQRVKDIGESDDRDDG